MQQTRSISAQNAEHAAVADAKQYERALRRKLQRALWGGVSLRDGRKMIGRFTVERRLGRGGAGDVYYARDERLGREVALKVLRAHGDPLSQARFERGAQAMALLSHPNVVRLLEIGDAEGVPFIVMEYVDGETLASWVEHGPRELRAVVSTFVAAGTGLAAAHEHGLVHRDFKPSNVMLGADGRVLVTDFGLARRPQGSTDDLSRELRIAGLLTGTPAYMAPELFAGGQADARSDQYSFCVALWEALYGRRPFQANNVQALVTMIHQRAPEAVAGVRVPRRLRRVLERGLMVDPGARWRSMPALLDALEASVARRWLGWLG